MGNFKLLFSSEEIKKRIQELAKNLDQEYQNKQEGVVAICVLKGAFIFFSDLLRNINFNPEIDFVRMASYGDDTCRAESIVFSKDIETNIGNKHVLIVEDIVDTGHTINFLCQVLKERNPRSIKVCALIHKLSRREVDCPLDYYGFKLKGGFVVGYGLDYAEKYRQFKEIYEIV